MIDHDDPRLDEWRDDARREAEYEAHRYEQSMACSGCEEVISVDHDDRTDEPFSELEPCEHCGTEGEWLYV